MNGVKPKVAVVSLSCCEGCQIQLLNLGEKLFEFLEAVELVSCRFFKSGGLEGPFDLTLVEGSVIMPQEVEKLEELRRKSSTLIALGSCACFGGIQSIKNFLPHPEAKKVVYGDSGLGLEANEQVRPLHEFIKVDYQIPGCPFDPQEFLRVIKLALLGKKPQAVDSVVCSGCKLKENGCLLELGVLCMGPVVRDGCGALCPTRGHPCEGCWGPPEDGEERVRSFIQLAQDLGFKLEEISLKFRKYAAFAQPYRRAFGGNQG